MPPRHVNADMAVGPIFKTQPNPTHHLIKKIATRPNQPIVNLTVMVIQSTNKLLSIPTLWGKKKLHRFIFAIAFSELHLLRQCLAHIYINKFSTICILYILYIIRDGEPAYVLKVQQAIAPCTYSNCAALSRDARLQL